MSASTTQKITKAMVVNIINIFAMGDGLIVRHKGKEYGAIDLVDGQFITVEGVALDVKACTIRKGLPVILFDADVQQWEVIAVNADQQQTFLTNPQGLLMQSLFDY